MSPRTGWPPLRSGMRIGLLGGSFDPPHLGHVHITRAALRQFCLDRVLWLVSPGNPLKQRSPAPMAKRLDASRRLMRHPRVIVTDLEAKLGTRNTAATLAALARVYPTTRFVWLMGADNLAVLHRWHDWRSIMMQVPVGVLARPGQRLAALNAPAARAFRHARLSGPSARALTGAAPPSWAFANIPLSHENSTDLRKDGRWKTNDVVTKPASDAG